jgi:8-oxo-dGTP pyrophosphatase MutT (NUDIX family)
MSLTDPHSDQPAASPTFDERFYAELSASLEQTLAHPIVTALQSRLDALEPVEAEIAPNSKLAAVVALLRVTENDSAELLFIKRAVIERDPWSGHVAFPGGRHDVADHTLADTAIRETREELSMDIVRYGRIIGQLDDLAPVSPSLPPIIIRPFVAVVPAALPFVLSEREVAGAFWVPVSLLRSAEAQSEFRMEREGGTARFPAYGVFGHTIWGLTERIVSQLLPLFAG